MKIVLVIFAVLAFLETAIAETNVEYLSRKLSIGYVDNPNASTNPYDTITPEQVIAGSGPSAFFTRPECAPFRELVGALYKPGTTDGVRHANFQRYLANLVRLQDQPIVIVLINDEPAPLTNSINLANMWINGNGRVWPHAGRWSPPVASGSGSFGGYFTFGNHTLLHDSQFSRAAYRLGVFAHEMTHTQDTAQWRAHLFGPYSYGSDGSHSIDEVIPDPIAAYGEAIANVMHMLVDPGTVRMFYQMFSDAEACIVVDRRPPGAVSGRTGTEAGGSVSTAAARRYAFRLINDLQSDGISPMTSGPSWMSADAFTRLNRTSALYRLRDLPVRYYVRNETIMALTIYYTTNSVGFDRMIGVYRRAVRATNESSSPAFGNFVHFMAETAHGGDLTASPGPDAPMKGFLPLALFDYFTRFSATDASTYKRALEFGTGPDDWVDAYFSSGFRERVRSSINLSRLTSGDIERIRAALNLPN
ncbi:MAG: hypothetical protein WCI55_04400 [Armatimonadota bacterium]